MTRARLLLPIACLAVFAIVLGVRSLEGVPALESALSSGGPASASEVSDTSEQTPAIDTPNRAPAVDGPRQSWDAEGRTLRGRVLHDSPDGPPAAFVQVCLHVGDPHVLGAEETAVAVCPSDVQGRFSFPIPEDWTGDEPLFLSTTDVFPAAMVRAHVEQENFLVLVTQSLSTGVSGRVVDEHGNAVSEFDLELYWDDLRVSVTEWDQPHAGGEFALQLKSRGLPREGRAWDGQLDVMAPGRRTLKLPVSGVVGVRTDLGVLRLDVPIPVLRGTVLDGSTGEPIEDAEVGPISMVHGLLEGVSFRQSEEIVWTDSEGRFSTTAVSLTGERLVELRVWAEGYATRHIELGEKSPPSNSALRIELDRGSALRGFARDAEGSPVEGVTVRVYRQAPDAALQLNQLHGPGLRRTEEDGAFSFEHLEAGTWILGYGFPCLSSGNLTGLAAMRTIEVPENGPGEPIELLVDSGYTVRARIRMGEQFPAQASLGFVVTGPLGRPVARGQLATGEFQLVGLSPGSHTLRVVFGWGRYLHDVGFQLGTADLDLGTIDLANWYSSARREMQEELAGK